MKADQIMDALGKVNEDYIMESVPGRKRVGKPHIRWIAAAIALISMFAFFRTAPGAAALEAVKEAVTNFIEALFPPRDITVIVEGEPEVLPQEAGGQGPEMEEDGTVTTPGFAIYYDSERYVMTEENGITYIRFVTDNDLPPCEAEITHIPDVLPADAAEAARSEMTESWNNVSEAKSLEFREGIVFSFSAGTNWDSACGDVYFLSDGRDGAFRMTARYFVEAAEGHGARFAQMLQTFEIIDP